MDAPSLQSRKRARARAALVRTALGLFEQQGFSATTVDQIVAEAEYSPSTFFRYFGTKEDVLFADVDQHLATLAALLAENLRTTASIWSAVVQSVEATTAGFIEADPEFAVRRVEVWMSAPALRARYVEHAAAWERTIHEAVARHRQRKPGHDVYASVVALASISAFRIAVESIPAAHGDFRVRLHEAFEILGAGLDTPPAD